MTTSMKNELRTDGVITTELNGRQRRALKKAQRAEQAKADAERAEQIAAETAENASEEVAVQAADAAIQAEADAETAETEANETETETEGPPSDEPTIKRRIHGTGLYGVLKSKDVTGEAKRAEVFTAMRKAGAVGLHNAKTAKEICGFAELGKRGPWFVRHYCYGSRLNGRCGVCTDCGAAYKFYLVK